MSAKLACVIDFWKSVIEHALDSWPVVALILGLLFRKPLGDLVKRINSIKAPGLDLSASQTLAITQLATKTIDPPEALRGETAPPPSGTENRTLSVPLDAELEKRRDAVKSYGSGSALVDETIVSIRSDLVENLRFPLGTNETSEILIRQLAVTHSMLRHEKTHRRIFGSQIVALHLLNNAGPQLPSELSPIFEGARTREPKFYGAYSFEEWLRFLANEVAITRVGEKIAITVYGRSYLEYIGVFASSQKPH